MKTKSLLVILAGFLLITLVTAGQQTSEENIDLFFENAPPETREKIEETQQWQFTLPMSAQEKKLAEPRDDRTAIQELLSTQELVDVLVWLQGTEKTSPPYHENIEEKRAAVQALEDEVLTTLTADDFKIKNKFLILNGFTGAITQSGLEKLSTDPRVKEIMLDGRVHVSLTESRPLVKADAVESLGETGQGVTVCVIDTGVDYQHQGLGGCFGPGCKVVMGYDFCNGPLCIDAPDPDPMDENGHGTHVAGIVSATSAQYRGIAPDTTIAALKALNETGEGTHSATAAAIDFCVNYGSQFNVKVISMSLGDGGEYTSTTCPRSYNTAITKALEAGISVAAASGNEYYRNGISYPACAPGVTSVGATYDHNVTGQLDEVTSFTNRGQNLDVLAPGSVITSTASSQGTKCGAPKGGFADCSGTSMAAPHVAGIAALLYQLNPSLKPIQVEKMLKATGKPVLDSATSLTFPRVDALLAAGRAANPDQWLDDRRLTLDPSTSANPAIAVDANRNVHVVWQDYRNGNYEIYYKKLNRYGENVTGDIRLTFNPSQSTDPVLSIDGNSNLIVLWSDTAYGQPEIFYKKLNNNGVSISPDIRISYLPDYSIKPSLALDGNNNIHAAWQEGNHQLYYKKLNTNGLNLTDQILLSQASYSQTPVIGVDTNNNIHVVWKHKVSPSAIAYIKLDNNGINLTPLIDVVPSGNQLNRITPTISLDSGGNIFLVWVDSYYISGCCYNQIIYKKLDNNGNSITPNIPIAGGGQNSYPSPKIALDKQRNINLLYTKIATPPNTYELYFTKFNESGSILIPGTRLTLDPSSSEAQAMILDTSNDIHAVWQDNRDENPEIYYKRSFQPVSIQGTPRPGTPINIFMLNPREANENYLLLMALGTSPGIPYQGYTIPLNFDGLLMVSLWYPTFFGLQNSVGALNQNGEAAATWSIPSWIPSGLPLYAAYLTFNQEGFVTSVSPAFPLTIQP